ncbi:MAG: HPr kinase/phosphorylase [Parvibaculales bacterium]
MTSLHANCVSVGGYGVLLRGPAGAGKSDLTLRLVDRNMALLVGDDQIQLETDGGVVTASPAPQLAGLLHVTHVGIVRRAYLSAVPLGLIVDLVPPNERTALPLLPEPDTDLVCGVNLPRLSLCAFEDSAPEKLVCAAALVHKGEIVLPKPAAQGIVEG